jgi:hypothetical protein
VWGFTTYMQEQNYKFTVFHRLGRSRSFMELRRLELLPALQIERQTSMRILAFLAASKGSVPSYGARLIAEAIDEMTKVD